MQLCKLRLLCGDCLELARHIWECRAQFHMWRPARQRFHAWLEAHVGPRAVPVQQQLWDSAVLELWVAAITAPSLYRAHMGMGRMTWEQSLFVR